jgi:SAM-dependent methyltransferase
VVPCEEYTQYIETEEISMTAIGRKMPASEGQEEHEAVAPFSAPPAPFDYSTYLQFQDRQWTREILAAYVPYFAGCRKVLDLACGPGIFLELLAESGIKATGVERNKAVAKMVRTQGWEVVEQDVFAFLSQCQNTYDGIFCSHFLEHLPFDKVLQLIELILCRLEPAGTLVLVFPNPESIRMQLFGFWRDPEHVRFYHPELIETVCRHYGLTVIQTNREASPFAFPPPPWGTAFPEEKSAAQADGKRGLRETIRDVYREVVRKLRLVPRADLVALEDRLRQEKAALQQTLAPWTEKATWAINRMWAWTDNALIVCRKPET